jgi:hypothetical protein
MPVWEGLEGCRETPITPWLGGKKKGAAVSCAFVADLLCLAVAAISTTTTRATISTTASTASAPAMPSSSTAAAWTITSGWTITTAMRRVHGFAIGVLAVEVGFAVLFIEVATAFKGDGLFAFSALMPALAAFSSGAVFACGSGFAFTPRLL